MDIIPEQLRYNSEFKSLSPQEQTEVIEYFAEKQPESTKAVYLDNANKVMEEMSRESGVGRVYVENKVMDSLKSVLPDGYNDLDKDSKIAAIDKALPILDQRAAEIDPVNKNDTAFYARRQLTQEMRSILGEDVGEFGDKRNRFIGGLIQSVTAPFSEEGTTEFLARNLPTKPEYDQTNASVLTQAAGDFVGQIGMIIGAATAITASGGTAGVALAGSTALGLAQNSSRKFQENYNLAKADMGLSDDEALQAGIAGMPGAVIDSFGDALLLRGIKLGTVGKAFKSMTATEKAAEIVAKGGAILKDPKALRTFGANFIKGGLAEGVSESLGDAATAWGGYATSGHEGFKPSAESLWQSFWVGGLLGGTFNSIANTGKDMKNTRSLQELGKLDQAQFVALGEDAQNQIADLMDKENYTGALEVVKKFKSLVAPAPTQTPAATTTGSQGAAPTPVVANPKVDASGNPIELADQKEKSDEEVAAEQIRIEDAVAGTAKNLRVAPENPAIAGLKQTILSAVPVALNAVRSILQISPETQGLPSGGQKVSLGELQSAIETLQQEKADAATKGKKQQSNQQQPPNADQGGQASQTGDSNSAQQGQAPQGEGQTLTPEQQLEAVRNMTPEQRAEASASLRAKLEADQNLTPEQRAAKVKEGVATEGEASPSFVITPSEAVAAQEEINKILAQIEKDKQDLAEAKKKAEEKAKVKSPKKSAKKASKKAEVTPQEDQTPQDQSSEDVEASRSWVTRRIDNMLMLAKYKSFIIPSFTQIFPTVQRLANTLKSRVSNGDMAEIAKVDKELNRFEADGKIVSKKDAAEMISFLEARLNTAQAESVQTGISNIQGAAQGGLLFQSDSGESFTSKNPKYKALSELTPAELASAATIVKALQALGINDQVSDADKLLALEIKQAINSGSFSDELISKLNEAAPSRAIFQNQVYALKGFGKTTKDTIMKHFDVMALNFLKTGNSLQAFWARVPDIVVVDSIKNQTTARGSFVTQGTGGRVAEDQGRVPTGELVTDVGISTDESVVDIPFSSVPNRIVLVRGKYNASTMFHENDHNMIITGMAQQIVEAQEGGVELWDEVLTEVGAKRGDLWTVAQHEKWARAREAWINGGEVKSVFTRVFNALKTIFTNLYTSGALTKHRNPVLEKAFVKIYDIGSDQQYETGAKQSETPTEEEKNQIQRDDRTAFEPSREGVAYPLAKRGSRAIISAREQTIIAKLSEFDGYEAKLNWLSENGFLTLIDGETHINYKNRIMVLMRLGDLNLPFYISTGQAGKQNVPKNKWYFVFGIGKDGWINKGTEEQIANQFGYPILQKMANILDNGVGFIDYDQVPRYEGYAVFEINSRTNLGIEPASYAEFDPWNPDLIPPELTQYINNVNIALTAINKRTTEIGNSLLAERKAKDSLRDDVKAKVSRETGYEASKLLAHVAATKLEHAQRIIEAVKLNPDLGAAKAELIVLATTIEGDTQAFTDDEVFAMLGVLEQVYTGKQTPLGLPLYDEVDNHFAAVKGSNTYYGAVRQKGKPRDVQSTYESEQPKSSLDTVVQSDPIEIQDDAKQSESGQKYEIAIVASKPEMSNEMREAIIQKMRGLSPNQTPIQAFYELSTQEPVVFTEPETGVTVIDVTESTIVDSDGSQVSVRANETIAAQANKTLSEVNKKAYASFVGALNWTSEVASKFAKDFADFMMGAKFPSAISDIFSRFMVSMKSTLIAGASFFSMTNFVGQELTLSEPVVTQTEKAEVKKFSVINPQKIKDGTYIDSLIDIYAAPQAPRYDEKVDSVSVHDEIKNDAQIVDEFVRQTNDNEGKPYIIVSKREGLIRLYDASGNLIHKSTVLLGKSYGDVVTDRNRTMAQTRANDSLKITPSGRYETKTSKSRNYGEVVGLESYNTGTRNAIHRVCTKFESQKRLTRLAGELSNRISLGCVNVYPATSKKVNDLMRDGGVVYVTPDSQLTEEFVEGMRESRPQESASLFQDSSMETVVTPEQDQQYLALAADPETNREALQKMVDEAAKAAGLERVYHGTFAGYTPRSSERSVKLTLENLRFPAFFTNSKGDPAFKLRGGLDKRRGQSVEAYAKVSDGKAVGTKDQYRNYEPKSLSELKSADLIIRDANGNIIPLSQRFNTQPDSLFQDSGTETVVTPEQDQEYLSLAADPETNREALQKMVDETAKDAGYDTKAWHGTIDDFDVFNMRYGRVMFYTKKELAEATAFGRASTTGDKSRARVMSVFLNTGKKFLGGRFTKKSEIGDSDSVITDNNVVVMFDPSRIKSAEPVTRDQSGNIIPLSKRFNPQSENILYQDSGMETVATQEQVDRFNELTKDLYPTRLTYIASFEADEWKKENPEKHQEIIEMRKQILKENGFYQKDGDLMPFYHGTRSNFFDTFNTNRSGYNFGAGAYFSGNEEFAKDYTGAKYREDGSMPDGSTLFKVYLKINNPYITDTKSGFSDPAYRLEREDNKKFIELQKKAAKRILADESRFTESTYVEVMNEMVRDMGYDSIIYNFYGNDFQEVIVFDPEQIKSEDPIAGGFKITPDKWASQVNPSILYQDSGMETVAQRDIIQEAIAPRTTNQLFQQDGAVEQRPTNFNSIVDIVQAIKGNRTDTPLKAVNKVIAESIEFRDRVKAESERRKQPRKVGVESIIERISRERSSGVIDTDTARSMISFVNSINPNLLEDTSISIRNRGRSAGTYDFVDNLVTLYKNKNGVTARTTSHEFWHGLSRYLPTDTLNEIKKDYVSDLNAYIKKNPSFLAFVGRYGLTQEEYDAYEFFASEADLKQLTKLSKLSPEGHAYSINFTKENYRFVMLDEYFAERMADLTESKNKPKGDTLISRMANLIREFLSIIKQSVSKDVYDNFYNAVMSDTARLDLQRLGSLDKPRKIFNPQRASDESASILYQFAGETAQRSQFLTDSLDTAKAMAAAGKTQEEIRAITGWFPSPYDGKMRWEIPDDKVEWIGPDSFAEMMVESNERKKPDKTSYYRFRLKDVISHKELFDAYPEAERIAFDIDENLKPLGQLKGNALKLWPTYDLSLSPKTKMKIILHEIQHWIQNKEGFAVGGSSDIIGRSNYYKLAGEIEARNIEARANLTPEQRAAIAPYSSENIAPEEAIVLFQAQESSGYSDSAIRGIIGMGHSMLQMAGRLNLKIDNNKIQKQINTLVNSQNNRSGKPVKGGTVQKAASALLKSFQEFHGNLDEADQGLLVKLAYEKSFAIEDAELDADSLARRNNVRKRKGQPIEEEQRVAIQEKVKTLYNTFRNARTRNFFKNRMEDQISPEFGKVADRILSLVNRGLDNVMGAFNSTNEDLLLRFADNIDAYNKKAYQGTPEFIEQFNDTVTEVEEAVMEHLVRQYYAYNSAYTDAEGISDEINALVAQLQRMPEESAMEWYERIVKVINQIEAAMFSIAAEGDPNGQSEKDKAAAKVRAKREKMAQTHQAALLEKFPTVDDYIAYQREKDGGVLTPEFEQILRDNYDNLVESQIEDLSDTDLRVYNSTALTMIVGGSNTQFLTLPKRQWREAKVASWHALVESMTDRVGQSPLVRSIYRSASRSNFLERQLNNFDKVFQANVENFHVWIDRFSQYAPVRNWFDRQFFADFQASVFTQAENARKAAESWSQETIDQYNDETDTTVDANPYLWVMSMLSQYNLGADPNKEFSKAVTRARTSIQRTIDQNRSARLVSEANRNLVALNYMMEGIDPEADNSYDLFMNNATVGNRIGAGNEEKAAKRLELLSNITNHFQQDIANQKFIRENIFGKPFQTVVNYLPLKALKVDGTLDEWDWTNIEPNAEYQQAAQNVNARSNEERADSLGQDRAYGMDFFNMVERKAVKNALDKHAILPVAILSDMFKTEEKIIDGVTYRVPKDNAIKTIFGSQPEVVGQLAIIKEKITHQMIQIYGATEPATGFVGGLRKALSVVQGSMLSGVGQIAQQSTAAVVDYAAREEGNIGYMIDAMIYWSKNYNKYRDWLLANNKDLYERGNTQGIREFERHVNNAGSELNSLLDKGWQGIDQIRKFMTISLRYGDKIGAELIFLAEHMKAVKQSGQMPTNGDYDISAYSNPYYTAQAQGQLAKFVGPSSAAGRSYWMSDHKQHYFLLRSLTGSFQSSAHNMSSQMLAAARNIVALQSDKSPEGKAERIAEYRKIGSIMAQQATFTGMRYLVGAMIGYAFVGAIKDAWDDEDGAIEEAQLALEAAKNKFYPSKAAKDMAVTMAERRLADAKSIRRSVTYMKQQASGDALFKSMVRDQLQNLHIVGSVGDGFVPKLFMMVPNSLAEQSHGDAQDLIISSLKKEKSEALAMGNRRKAAQISESILNAQAIEYIPYFYDKKDKSGFGGIVGGMLDPIFSSVKEGVEDMTRADKDFLTTRAFVPDMITYMAALGLGQADVNRIARQLQRMDDDLSKNRDEANERAGKEVDKLTNKSKTPFLR